MTDYIVEYCEAEELNGTYVQDTYFGFGDYYWLLFDGNGFEIDNLVGYLFSDEYQFPSVNLFSWDSSIQYIDYNNNPYPTLPDDPLIMWVSLSPFTYSDLTVTAVGGSSQNLTLTCAAGSYSLTGTNVTLTHTPASQNLTLACEAGSYALTGNNADLTVTRHYTLSVGGAYPDIAVSGAGTSDANGTYTFDSIALGKPAYKSGDNIISWYVDRWAIYNVFEINNRYESTEDVATPDLVTTWTVGGDGTAPVPTVTVATTYSLTGTDATLTAQFHYSLTCEAGSYTLTGTDITFGNTKAYSLTCEAGAYTLTGSSVSFVIQRNYSLACEAGSYSLTGTDATLSAQFHYTLSLKAGTYSLTGTNAGLTSARTMACNAGSYTLTGTNADFFAAIKPATDAMLTNQAFGWFGFPVGGFPLVADPVNQDYTLTCSAGSYSLTGTNADFEVKRNYTLECASGSYSLTGSNVDLIVQHNYVLTLESGSYSLTGSDVTLDPTFHYSITLEAGSYNLTGADVTLTKTTGAQSYTLVCSAGSYNLTGTNTGLTSARTMALASGSYALTGTNASLFKGLVLPCASGTYSLTGSDATLNANYVFALGMGSYVLVGTSAGLFILSPTPACRTATIEFENRTFAIPHENRTATIEYENRTLEVKCH